MLSFFDVTYGIDLESLVQYQNHMIQCAIEMEAGGFLLPRPCVWEAYYR